VWDKGDLLPAIEARVTDTFWGRFELSWATDHSQEATGVPPKLVVVVILLVAEARSA
jgi:hypothetical protein